MQGGKVAEAVVSDAIAAHHKVFGVLSRAEQATLRELLGRVIEQGTGHSWTRSHRRRQSSTAPIRSST